MKSERQYWKDLTEEANRKNAGKQEEGTVASNESRQKPTLALNAALAAERERCCVAVCFMCQTRKATNPPL